MNTETTKKWLFLFSSSLLGVIPLILLTTRNVNNYVESAYARKSIPYSCASYHFGMDDNTQKAKTYTSASSKSSFTLNSNYYVNGISFSSTLLSNIYFDTTHNYAIRVGMERTIGKITWTSDRPIIQITCYCFTPKQVDLTVNGQTKTIRSGSGLRGYIECELYYSPYVFELEQTNELVLRSKNIYIADITFRTL